MIATWSPNASDVGYDDGAGPHAGAWFSGRNNKGDKEWTSRSQVVEAQPGARFAFVVGGADDGIVRWTWTLRPEGDGRKCGRNGGSCGPTRCSAIPAPTWKGCATT
jgi:hypothetical protein